MPSPKKLRLEQEKTGKEHDVIHVPSTSQQTRTSRIPSVLQNAFHRKKACAKLSEKKGQRDDDDPTRHPSQCPGPPHQSQGTSRRTKSRIAAALRRVFKKRSHHVPGSEEDRQGQEATTSAREQPLEHEREESASRQPSEQSEDSPSVARHPSAVAIPQSPGSVQPILQQRVSNIENVYVTGDKSPCFFGPVSGTFHVTVVSTTTALGHHSQPYSMDAITKSLPSSVQDSTNQGVATQTTGEPGLANSDNEPLVPNTESYSTRRSRDTSSAQLAADSCEEALKKWYTTTGCYAQMIPWVDDDTKHIMDIYTSLQLICDNIDGELISYQGIFLVLTREGNAIKRIILNGMAGVGKSTLIGKISYDWAMKCLGVLQKYKLVFALKMHSLEQNSELIDSVFEQLLDRDTSIDRHALKSFIDANPEKVLILLDGFDEFMSTDLCESSFGSVLKILNRRECRDCCVVVTTRSSHVSRLVSKFLIQKPFTHVKVLGFTKQDVEKYVIKFYSEEPGKAHNLFKRIHSSGVLLDLAKSPMLLLLMCVLWRDDSSLPDTMFRLYSEALVYIFKRKSDITPAEIRQVVIEIGKVAFHGLVSPVQLLSFEEREFEKRALDTALKVGLLTCQRVLKGLQIQNDIQFMHMTFQEFCAAKYFQNLLEIDPEECQKILDQTESNILNHPARLVYLLRFCCGDNESCATKILQTLQQNPFSDAVLKLALVCFFESQSKNTPSVDFVRSVLTEKISIEEYNSDCLNSFVWFLKHVMDHRVSVGKAELANVQELEVRRCNLQRFDSGLTYPMSEMTSLSVLILNECSLTADNMEHIAPALGNIVNLTELDLSGNEDLGGTVPLWVPHLHTLKHLKKLKVEDCHVNRGDVRCLATSVGYMDQLVNCSVQTDLRHQSPKDDLVWPTNPLVIPNDEETCSGHGVTLNLTDCSLGGTEVAEFMEAMTQRSDLVQLDLSRNNALSGSAALWFCSLKHLKQLEQLLLSDCSLQCSDIEHIAVSLGDMPSMAELDLSLNNLGGSAVSWAPHMQGMKHLQRLNLKSCSLTGEDVKLMAISLSCVTTLIALDLSCNEALAGSIATWAPYLQQMKYLQRLYLRQCALTSDDVKCISVPLSSMPECVDLNLSSNEQLSGTAVIWSPHLVSMQHLRNLALLGCNLNKQDLKHLASSVGSMPNLIDCSVRSAYLSGRFIIQQTKTGIRFDLSHRSLTGKDLADILEALRNRSDLVEFILGGSDALSGSAILWSPHLKQLKQLEQLEICHCLLQRTDIEHISATLRDMSSLTKLDLSQNVTLGGSGKAWSPHLKQMKHLQTLNLSSCALTGVDMKHIAVALDGMTTLMELKLSYNDSLAGTVSLWYSYLQSLTHLQTLELDECNFKRQEFKHIAASIGHMGNLVNCSVRSNYLGGRFKFMIQPNPSGIQVSLSERSLSGTDLAGILKALSTRADLTEFSLIGIDDLKSASLWSPSLKHLQHLQMLVLKRCALQDTDIGPIAMSLSAIPALVGLDLSDNRALGGQGKTWASHLQQVNCLQKLRLMSCALTHEDVKFIAVACSRIHTLSELDLSNNETLSHCAASWVPCLKQVQHLQTLSVVECSLTGEDKKCIATTLSDTIHYHY